MEEYANENTPSIILMDINLPGLNGFDALSLLKENPRTANVPVFALSAAAMPSDIQNGLDAGFKRYITKCKISMEYFSILAFLTNLAAFL